MRFFNRDKSDSAEESPIDANDIPAIGDDDGADPDATLLIPIVPEDSGELGDIPAGTSPNQTLGGRIAAYIGKHTPSGKKRLPDPADPAGDVTQVVDITDDDDDATTVLGPEAGGTVLLAPGAHAVGAVDGQPPKKRNGKKIAIITICSVVGVLAVAYIAGAVFFMSHFGANTVIGGDNASFKTVEEVEEELVAKAADYSLTYIERGDKTEVITGGDIEYRYDPKANQVQSVLDAQQPWAWPLRFFKNDEEPAEIRFAFNPDLFNAKIDAMQCMLPESQIAPVNAYPEFDGTHYVAHPEELGTTVDRGALGMKSAETASLGIAELNMSDAGCYVPPAITTESPELKERIELLDRYVPFALTYTFADGSTERLDGETIFEWLTINEDGTYTFDEDAVRGWVSDFAARHDTVGHERVYQSVDGNTYSVSGGTYGWSVDEEAEVGSIEYLLENKISETREPYWASTAAVPNAQGTEPDWGNTYLDLGIGSQHVYYIQDGQVVFEADVVTGLPGKRSTPQGVWSILEMEQNRVLRGEMTAAGVPEYQTPVAYWMRVTWSGVGFHDATWQYAFGGTRYLYYGSHGCINMSYSDAQTLYSLISVGTPCIIHE